MRRGEGLLWLHTGEVTKQPSPLVNDGMYRHSHGPRPNPQYLSRLIDFSWQLLVQRHPYSGRSSTHRESLNGRMAASSCRLSDPTPRFHCRYRIVDSLSWPGHVSESPKAATACAVCAACAAWHR